MFRKIFLDFYLLTQRAKKSRLHKELKIRASISMAFIGVAIANNLMFIAYKNRVFVNVNNVNWFIGYIVGIIPFYLYYYYNSDVWVESTDGHKISYRRIVLYILGCILGSGVATLFF